MENINPKHNLYLIRSFGDGTSMIKLGYSSKIIKRLKFYLTHNPLIEIIATFYREDAKQFEKSFHCTMESMYKREWYDEIEISRIFKRLKHNGVNRSYLLADLIENK